MSPTNRARTSPALAAIATACLLWQTADAASISVSPATQTVTPGDGFVVLEIIADFTGVQSVGGGIDIDLQGPLAIGVFTPSAFFESLDPFFTDYGTAAADADFEIHFGSFSGFTGVNKVGDLTLDITGAGLGTVALAINSTFGPFFSADVTNPSQIDVDLVGAEVNVVPLPASAWLLLTAVAAVAGRRLRNAA